MTDYTGSVGAVVDTEELVEEITDPEELIEDFFEDPPMIVFALIAGFTAPFALLLFSLTSCDRCVPPCTRGYPSRCTGDKYHSRSGPRRTTR